MTSMRKEHKSAGKIQQSPTTTDQKSTANLQSGCIKPPRTRLMDINLDFVAGSGLIDGVTQLLEDGLPTTQATNVHDWVGNVCALDRDNTTATTAAANA